ncbi:MAG: hypothetical protein AAGF89_09225 [Bacteroidota bacterium]
MSSDNKQNRIDDYLLNRASAQGRREFEEEVSRNAELSNDLADTELALAAIELAEDRALKARLQQLEESISSKKTSAAPAAGAPQEAKVTKLKPRLSRNRWLAIAASLLLLLAVGWWALQPVNGGNSGAQLAMANFEPYPNIAYQLERGSPNNSPEEAAFLAYEAGDFQAASAAFLDLPASSVGKFYLGQSYLAIEEFAAAEAQFVTLAASEFNLAPESSYYLALARLGQGKVSAAKEDLEAIVKNENHPSYTKAKALLEKI